jgi:flagellar motility protein MotE (MotC chaperone)
MKLSLKDLVAIGVVTILSFPALYFIMLFATGNARIEFGKQLKEEKRQEDLRVMRLSSRHDSLMARHSAAYRAVLAERKEIEEKAQSLKEREERIAMMEQELEQQRLQLEAERKRLEQAVAESDEASEKKIRQLARVYGAMRPAEAARILETLSDDLVIRIMRGIGDDRQKGKIMSALSQKKASRISRKMGKKIEPGQS